MGSLDDAVACIHLGTVEQDDEQGRFWFNTASVLAQALGLGRELSPNAAPIHQSQDGSVYSLFISCSSEHGKEEMKAGTGSLSSPTSLSRWPGVLVTMWPETLECKRLP